MRIEINDTTWAISATFGYFKIDITILKDSERELGHFLKSTNGTGDP